MADATPLPTTDDLAGMASLPTTDELAAKATSHGVFSGAMSDAYYAVGGVGRALTAFGQGASQGWGDSQTLPEDSQKELDKTGSSKDFKDGKSSVLKSSNEAWMRSAASRLYNSNFLPFGLSPATVAGGASALMGGISAGGEQGAEEVSHVGDYLSQNDKTDVGLGRLAGYPFHAAGEIASGILQGAYLPEAAGIHDAGVLHGDIDPARSVGAIGETENKYFGTVDPSATDKAARAEATAATVNNPDITEDVHDRARRYAPEEFNTYDDLSSRKEALQSQLSRLDEERQASSEVQEAHQTISSVLDSVNGDESELSESRQDELSKARDTLQEDTPEMSQLRGYLKGVDSKITDVSPAIQDAYKLADLGRIEVNPEAAGAASEPESAPNTEAETETANQTSTQTPEVTPQKSAEELSKGVIAKDVESKLIAAGRPPDEAKIAGVLWQQRYETRSATSPHLGSAEEIYRREGPDIRQSTAGDNQKGSYTRDTPQNVIRLFKTADASTFLHETGHSFLEQLMKDGSHELASDGLKTDAKAARDYLGNTGEALTRVQHEKFARSFERYLREGIAPTRELAIVFQRFKVWLSDIYKTLRQLPNSKIDDSIRSVFDRLIVPDREKTTVTPESEADEFAQTGRSRGQQTRDFINDVKKRAIQRDEARGRQIAAHIESIKEQARTRQILQHMDEIRTRAAQIRNPEGEGRLTDKRFIGAPEGEGKPLPDETPVEKESGEAETVSNNEEGKGKPSTDPNSELKSSSPLVDKAGNIRVENLTSDADLQESIKQAYEANKEELDKARDRVSPQATIDLASASGIKTNDINMLAMQAAARNGGIPLSSYISLLRDAFLESAKNLKGIMAGEDEIAYAEASTRHLALSRHLMGITAEWGRAGHSFRSLAEEAKEAQQLNEFLQTSIGKTLRQLKSEMGFGRYLDSPAKVSGYVQDMSKAGYGEWVLEAFKNWLISGPITHTTYAIGNELFAIQRLLEAGARVGISALREDSDNSSHLGELRERAYGIATGHLDGLRAGWDAFKAGQTALLPGEERASTVFTNHRQIPGLLGTIVRLPSERLVAPLHSFARSVAFMEERNGLIFRQAYSEGHTGVALQERIAELKTNVPPFITVQARSAASEAALMGRPGEFTRKAVAFVNSELDLPKWAGGTWRPGGFIAPFVTVSSNINRLALLERTPIGLASKAVRDDLFGNNGRYAQDVALSKMAVGTALGVGVGTLYAMEHVTPAAPQDYKQATVEQMVNGMPHSVRVGEMSYDLNRLGILGTTISAATDIAAFTKKGVYEAYEKDNPHLTEEAAVEWFQSMKDHLTSEGFLSGITDLLKAVNDSGRYGESWTKNFVSTLVVPYSVGMTQVAQRIDPYSRDTKGSGALDSVERAIKARIPFESETLPMKIDLFGQPIPNKEYYGVYATRVSQDPAWTALKDVGYFPAPVKRTIMGVSLTPEQYQEYAVKSGVTTKMLLDNVVGMKGFDNLSPSVKHDLVKDAVTAGRQSGASAVMAEYANSPDSIIRKAIETKQDLSKGKE